MFICIFNHVFFQMSVGMLKLIPAFTLGWTELMYSLLIPLCSLERVTILFIQRYCCRKQYITHVVARVALISFSTSTAVARSFLLLRKVISVSAMDYPVHLPVCSIQPDWKNSKVTEEVAFLFDNAHSCSYFYHAYLLITLHIFLN